MAITRLLVLALLLHADCDALVQMWPPGSLARQLVVPRACSMLAVPASRFYSRAPRAQLAASPAAVPSRAITPKATRNALIALPCAVLELGLRTGAACLLAVADVFEAAMFGVRGFVGVVVSVILSPLWLVKAATNALGKAARDRADRLRLWREDSPYQPRRIEPDDREVGTSLAVRTHRQPVTTRGEPLSHRRAPPVRRWSRC